MEKLVEGMGGGRPLFVGGGCREGVKEGGERSFAVVPVMCFLRYEDDLSE